MNESPIMKLPTGENYTISASPRLQSTITFGSANKQLATFSPDGVFSVSIAATDENTKMFVEHVEQWLQRRMTSMVAHPVDEQGNIQ